MRRLVFHPVTSPGAGGAVTIHNRLPWEIVCGDSPPFFQGVGGKGGQVDFLEAVFGCQNKAFGQVIAGDDLSLFFRLAEKLPGALGGGGVVHVENADDGGVPHRHVAAYG